MMGTGSFTDEFRRDADRPREWATMGTATGGVDEADTDPQRPRTSDPHWLHRIYPCLLRKLAIRLPDHVWCAEETCIPMRRGFLYLVAIMGWATHRVLARQLSSTMDAGFCGALQEEALAHQGGEIFNSDQSSRLPASRSPACCVTSRAASAWMVGAHEWTVPSSNGSGGH